MSESEETLMERMYHEALHIAVARLRRAGHVLPHYERIYELTLPVAGNAIAEALDILRQPYDHWNSTFCDVPMETAMPVSLEMMESADLRVLRTERVLADGWAALLPLSAHSDSHANLRVARHTIRWAWYSLQGDDDEPMESESDSGDPTRRPEPEPEPEPWGY